MLPDNVKQDLVKLVPSSIINEISSFAFFDNHPRDERDIEIVVCTARGEVKEFSHREVVCSAFLEDSTPTEITLIRNSKCELFYLVAVGDVLYILSRKDSIRIHKKIINVDRYDVDDNVCRGQAYLKIVRKDDAVPLIFDDNFENFGDQALLLNQLTECDTLPLLTDLMRKLTEAKFSVKSNEKAYKELLTLRQTSAFSSYEKINPFYVDAAQNTGSKLEGSLKIKTQKPWVKVCNMKIVIALDVLNKDNVHLEDVHILFHRTTRSTIVYTTKLFKSTTTPPFWKKKQSQSIKPNQDTAVVAVIDLKEIKHDVTSKTEFNGVICYKNRGKEYLLPFEKVIISATGLMVDQHVLANIDLENEKNLILALLATTVKIDLSLRTIQSGTKPDIKVADIFCNYLQMDKVANTNNIVYVHRKSPYHPLHGIMVVLHENEQANGQSLVISLHTRSPSQILALIHYIHDAVPCRMIVTTTKQKITAKINNLSHHNEEIVTVSPHLNYVEYGTTILNQTSITMEYLDKCMIKMNESKNPAVQSKVGSEIDIFAGGNQTFLEYRNRMLEEASKSCKYLKNDANSFETECNGMVTEID